MSGKKISSDEETKQLFDSMILVDINNRADYFDVK